MAKHGGLRGRSQHLAGGVGGTSGVQMFHQVTLIGMDEVQEVKVSF